MGLESYSQVVQGMALLASIKLPIIICARGHNLRHSILMGHKCLHSGDKSFKCGIIRWAFAK